jgi:hypothetical protein
VSASWQDARWADASGLVDWLDTKVTTRVIGETNARRVRFWRKDGGLADFYALDRILTAAGLHPSDVPEHLWRPDHPRKTQSRVGTRFGPMKLKEADVLEIRRRCDRGDVCAHVAREFKVDAKTVRYIANRKTWTHLKEAA